MTKTYSDEQAVAVIDDALERRFGETTLKVDSNLTGLSELAQMVSRRVHRRYLDRPVDGALLKLLCAAALSAPSKSDLQQAEIVIVNDIEKRRILCDLLPDQTWMRTAPSFLVFIANGQRLPEMCRLRGKPFPNDHLDAFFNASLDAGIALATFLRAADVVGLGCCPISVIRDHSTRVSEILALPQRIIPVAGLCVGWPSEQGTITPRLPLTQTVHHDRYQEGDLATQLTDFDRRRALTHPLGQRDPVRWGVAEFHGWSEDKARQFGVPQCPDFGAFVRDKGFRLD